MIQACSRCGTRWNVRDRQRSWCPRCQGALLAPIPDAAEQGWNQRPTSGPGGTPPRLPAGYRWIAVRPGSAPPPRRGNPPLGPTPRYSVIPRWGLAQHFDDPSAAPVDATAPRSGPAPNTVRLAFAIAALALLVTAFLHVVRYVLLLVNRSVLLHPLIAGAATWLGVAMSVIALFAVGACFVVFANWLVGRRGAAYAVGGVPDPRSAWEIRIGCLAPLANLLLAPVYVTELARVENRTSLLRRDIGVWWCAWVFSYVLTIWAFATSFTRDPQGIANNTVTTIVAYLLCLATLTLAFRVFQGFERSPVDRPTHRWVMVPIDDGVDESDAGARPTPDGGDESGAPVEGAPREPAALTS